MRDGIGCITAVLLRGTLVYLKGDKVNTKITVNSAVLLPVSRNNGLDYGLCSTLRQLTQFALLK